MKSKQEQLKEHLQFKNILIVVILLLGIMGSAMMVIQEVFDYRHDYREYSRLLKEKDDLNAQWGRLLIEQQAFGATSQIGSRAVTQLRMFSPPIAKTVVIESQPNQ